MALDSLVKLFVTVAVIEMMVTVGLGVAVADLIDVGRDVRLLARAILANYVIVPAVTVGLLVLLGASPMVAAGFLILAVCPGAPFGPPLVVMAGGNAALSVGWMTILAVTSAVIAPAALYLLLPLFAGAVTLTFDVVCRIMSTLSAPNFCRLPSGSPFATSGRALQTGCSGRPTGWERCSTWVPSGLFWQSTIRCWRMSG